MNDLQKMRQDYKSLGNEITRLAEEAEEARRRLAEAEAALKEVRARSEAEIPRLNALDERAALIWRELTTRFGSQATGPIPDPAPGADAAADAEHLLRDAHQRVREPIHYPMVGRYVLMGVLGFAAAAACAVLGLLIAKGVRDTGGARAIGVVIALGAALVAPWIGYLAAKSWIRIRMSHEARRYAEDTVIAGGIGGAGIWLIALIIVVIRWVI